jgi:hypothetical protein
MHVSLSIVMAAASRELFLAPMNAPVSSGGVVAAPSFAAPAEIQPQLIYAEEPQYAAPSALSSLVTPAIVVALAVAGYTIGRSVQPSIETRVEPEASGPSALELAGADVAMLGVTGRREALAKAGAAAAAFAAAGSASAKAGQFSKIEIFSIIGQPAISSPYQAGGPKAGKDATFGYKKSEGEFVANGYELDVTREKEQFEVSAKIVLSQGPNIESKTWWLVRDNLRGQAYNMKANMKAINSVLEPTKSEAAVKATKTFWKKVDDLDLACKKKELALAQKCYGDVIAALKAYEAIALAA